MVLTAPPPPSGIRPVTPGRTHSLRSPLRTRIVPTTAPTAPGPQAQYHSAATRAVVPGRPAYANALLSSREIDVLRAWLYCDSKIGVAATLHIALGTVNTHLTRIRIKYSAVGRPAPTKAALVARALQDGIVALDDL
ncbi:LuxR C-terminal-related transcriptional regulator [Rhodococcoides fascians]|uniref:LuxR C-terminal-related transcriptional regulator n=1 Tax=Rhodococcoides fascians TaxID=1828 RepID=UPI0009B90AD7|nr:MULTISPECIES: LuxR C-terminal-related transcriptional regulator [Rhodococcus]OZE97431.1 hypothetical protein CH301_17850 [Rhodococcus sp. 15-1189-1-1a]OZF12124.1 hypothetical protein CH299_18540 [Rhodococcus sp. 14-2686-1-2]